VESCTDVTSTKPPLFSSRSRRVVNPTGTVCFYSLAPTDLVVDLSGWFAVA